jgi:hypothetical protein
VICPPRKATAQRDSVWLSTWFLVPAVYKAGSCVRLCVQTSAERPILGDLREYSFVGVCLRPSRLGSIAGSNNATATREAIGRTVSEGDSSWSLVGVQCLPRDIVHLDGQKRTNDACCCFRKWGSSKQRERSRTGDFTHHTESVGVDYMLWADVEAAGRAPVCAKAAPETASQDTSVCCLRRRKAFLIVEGI